MKKLLAACVAVLVLFSMTVGVASADTLEDILKRGSLRVGMEPGYMPFELTNQKGEIIGFDVDVAKRMAKAMGVKLELVSTAWDGIIPALLTKKFDILMSGMTLTQERNLTINFAHDFAAQGTGGCGQVVQRPQQSEIQSRVQTGHHRRTGYQAHDPQG